MTKTYKTLVKEQEKLLKRKNKVNKKFYNGVYDRYLYPVITRHHVPIHWRFDLDKEKNPYLIERLGINATFNPGAIYFEGKYYLMVRTEGLDRKSFFTLAVSDNGIDNFRFLDRDITWEDIDKEETNIYDMRLTLHEDGYIYGIYCSESKDKTVPASDTSSATAQAGIVRTKDLVNFERLPNLKTKSPQQRNVVLHPEFVNGKYMLYTRPQDDFIQTGSGGGIAYGFTDSMENAVINEEIVIDERKYHTVYEVKNGEGPSPIKGKNGWIHIAHGVRNTAAGLRYVIYAFMTDLNEPYKVIKKPTGHLIAPYDEERVGDVSNVVFTNGAVINEKNEIFIYYASSDTRVHVAKTTLERLEDYIMGGYDECFRALDSQKQRFNMIKNNNNIINKERR